MHLTASPYIIIGLFISAVFAALFIYIWRYRTMPKEAAPLSLALLTVSMWLAAYSLGLISIDLETKLLWAKIEYIGITLMPLCLVSFAIFYARLQKWQQPKILALLAIIPLVTLVLAWTNESHELIWRNVSITPGGPLTFLVKSYGAWFWIYGSYTYLLLAASSFLLVRKALATSQKKLAVAVIAGVLTPWISNILYVLQVRPESGLDLTPYAFAFTALMLLLIIFRYKLLDILPIARSAVIDYMNDGLIILDEHDQILDLNPVAQRILGFTKYEATGKMFGLTALAQTSDNSSQAPQELTIDNDGEKQHYDIASTPLDDNSGKYCGRVILLRDISERTNMEARLKLSEQWYRNLFNASPEAIMLIDAEVKIREVSDRFYELTGYNAEQILNKSVLDLPFLPENSLKIVAQKVALRLQQQEIYPYEIDVITASGERLDVRLFGTLMNDIQGQASYDLVMALDITAEKKSQEELMRSEAKLKDYSENLERVVEDKTKELKIRSDAVQKSISAIGLSTLGREVMYVNDSFLAMWGYENADEVIGKSTSSFWVDSNLGTVIEKMVREKGMFIGEAVGLKKDGSTFIADLTINTIKNDAGEHICFMGSMFDITRRKELEKKLMRSEKLTTIGQLASGVAHDLRNPLNVIKNAAFLLQLKLKDDDSDNDMVQKYIGLLNKAVDTSDNIIGDLLVFAGTSAPKLQKVDIGEILDSVLSQIQTTDEIALVPEISPNLPQINADEGQIQRVFQNMIDNAMRAIEQAGTLTVRANIIDRFIQIEIQDTGTGIAAEHLDDIFEPLFTTYADRGGTGLGLSICSSIIEAHNGTIDVASKEGIGTTFTIKLPI
ncbi:MAG: PAS domain S-box protein [Chloroflexi bacterium]|nr:PAS domain S-box protein [Chloroflexota bacterium]MBT7080476.1 PAS domain S-box protein [Chloroflexota bacterium]MBT7289877.1 PAS domain S-box protein [Chloroflexota bacterium]